MVSKRKLPLLILAFWLTVFGVPAGAQSASDEDAFWKSVRKGNVTEEYEIYLQQYPKGKYVAEARRRIGQLGVPGGINNNAEVAESYDNLAISAFERNDLQEALLNLRKAADLGHPRAEQSLGLIYEHGLNGQEKDYFKGRIQF